MRKIKVLLSYAQVIFREGIHFTLSGEEDFEVTSESTNNDEALTFLKANPPDIAMLSFKNGKLDGYGVTRYIKRNFPSVSVILILDNEDEDQILTAMKSGARACIYKDAAPEDLIGIVREVSQGSQPIVEALLKPGLASRVSVEFKDSSALNEQIGDLLAALSPTEVSILDGIAAGGTIEQVTNQLNTDETTIRHQLRQIINKLVINDQNKAIIEVALRNLPSLFTPAAPTRKRESRYLTRKELTKFKEDLIERCKELIDELAQHHKSGGLSRSQPETMAR